MIAARTDTGRFNMFQALARIFSWWNGATIGTLWTVARRGRFIAQDAFGNRYYEARDARDSYDGRTRRWVTYRGYAEPTKIPPEWHAWMHYLTDSPPSVTPLHTQAWETAHQPNMTGTDLRYRPAGAISATGPRAKASADYDVWTPKSGGKA